MPKFIIKSEEIPTKGEYPGARKIETLLKNGFVILDKWPGPTSRDVSSQIRKITGSAKAAHAGTLDPKVSGVLPILLGNACKVMPALQKLDKEYVGIMKLHKDVKDKELKDAIKKFTGKITQRPPVRAAVARKERTREVHDFKILERDGKNVLFQVVCEAGTYVRTLCHQIGKEIGGAHMTELRRTRAGPFDESMAIKVQNLVDAIHGWKENGDEEIRSIVLPVEEAVEHLKKIIVRESAALSVANGSPLYSGGVGKVEEGINENEPVAMLTPRGELVAIGNAVMKSEAMMKRRGIAAKPDRVIIDKSLYK